MEACTFIYFPAPQKWFLIPFLSVRTKLGNIQNMTNKYRDLLAHGIEFYQLNHTSVKSTLFVNYSELGLILTHSYNTPFFICPQALNISQLFQFNDRQLSEQVLTSLSIYTHIYIYVSSFAVILSCANHSSYSFIFSGLQCLQAGGDSCCSR